MEQRMKIAEQIADHIQAHFGYRATKCLDMAMRGEWWKLGNSALSSLSVEDEAKRIIDDIEKGTID